MKKYALVLAGGIGKRMQSQIPKQFLSIKKKPILIHTLEKFSEFDRITIVLPADEIGNWKKICKEYNFTLKHAIVEGGKSRFHSVKNGLEKIAPNGVIAIHDGVRPIISKKLIQILLGKVKKGCGAIPVIPVKDSLRRKEKRTSFCVDRSMFYTVQTPQCFLSKEIKEAYTKDFDNLYTDDASVFEANGGKITTILGEEKNLKITSKEDLRIADLFIK